MQGRKARSREEKVARLVGRSVVVIVLRCIIQPNRRRCRHRESKLYTEICAARGFWRTEAH